MCSNCVLNVLCLDLLCCDMGCGLSTFNEVLFDLIRFDNHIINLSLNFYRLSYLPDTQPAVSKLLKQQHQFDTYLVRIQLHTNWQLFTVNENSAGCFTVYYCSDIFTVCSDLQ